MSNNQNNQSDYKTSLSDSPFNLTNLTTYKDLDTLDINYYKDALVEVIEKCETPNTIAIQGEWGSGKTSLMKGIKADLCEGVFRDKIKINDKLKIKDKFKVKIDAEIEVEVKADGKGEGFQFYPIWINTWHYDLTDSPSQAIIDILKSTASKITSYAIPEDSGIIKKALSIVPLFILRYRFIFEAILFFITLIHGTPLDATLKSILKHGNTILDKIEKAFYKRDKEHVGRNSDIIRELRNNIKNQIGEILRKSEKKGFIFFIDDLDRINPTLAVDLLEILKNLFDFKGCIFILAMDHKVLVRGLQPKLGTATFKNRHEFLRYFDKFVQLPFTLPVSDYNTDNFLKKYLHEIASLDIEDNEQKRQQREFNKDFGNQSIPKEELELLRYIVKRTVSNNPRSLKRLINSIALIDSIRRHYLEHKGIKDPTPWNIPSQNKIMLLIFTCMQITFPTVYHFVINHPKFTNWDDDLATSLYLPNAELATLNKIKRANFDILSKIPGADYPDQYTTTKSWEMFLFRFCQQDKILQQNFVTILFLVNVIVDRYKNNPKVMESDFMFMSHWLTITDVNFTL